MPLLALKHRRPWVPHADREERLRSAIQIASMTLENLDSLYPRHARELLKIAAWKASELDGKESPRYRSASVMSGPILEGSKVVHEHVVDRRWIVDALIDRPDRVVTILSNAPACLVTASEHLALGSGWGWDRYIEGQVRVRDAKTDEEVDLVEAQRHLRAAIGEPPDQLES